MDHANQRGRGRGRGRRHGSYRGHSTRDSSTPGEAVNQRNYLGFRELEAMSCKSAEETLINCCRDNFCGLLRRDLGDDWVHLVLQCISNSYRADGFDSYKQTLTQKLLESDSIYLKDICVHFLTNQLQKFKLQGGYTAPLQKTLENYLEIWENILSLDMSVSKTMWSAIETVSAVLNGFMSHQFLVPVIERYRNVADALFCKAKEENMQMKSESRQQRHGRLMTDTKPLDDFRNIPSYPLKSDVDSTRKVSIRPNKVDGAYESASDYLDIQFRLLREDFIGTLRTGLKDVREKQFDGKRYDDVWLYHELYILQPNFGKEGVTYTIGFNPFGQHYRHIRWNSGKRLIYGSLLCISDDYFAQSLLFAKIVNSKPETLAKEGTFEIQFLEGSEVQASECLEHRPYMAIESSAYYESYSHVLDGLKELACDTKHFPMKNYIIFSSTTVQKPTYLRYESIPFSFYDKNDVPLPVVDISRGKLPTADNLGLDPSQYEAFVSAITSEFSVIQGPPGTGKTYLGLKIVKTLLPNLYGMRKNSNIAAAILDRPILVVCFTNHALDQFLEGMLYFCEASDIVRVGGRSKSEKLKACNIKNQDKVRSLGRSFYELRVKKRTFEETTDFQSYIDYLNLTFTHVMSHKTPSLITSEHHYLQLDGYGAELKALGLNNRDPMHDWLSLAPIINQLEVSQAQEGTSEPNTGVKLEDDLLDIEGEYEKELDNRVLEEDIEDESHQNKKRANNFLIEKPDEPVVTLPGADGFTVFTSKKNVRKQMAEIRKKLLKRDMMNENEACNVGDIWKLDGDKRWRLYRFWVHKFRKLLQANIERIASDYEKITKMEEELQDHEKVQILSKAKVIGMTTTGAAKHLHILQKIGAPIVIVEEAAEVLEAHIITSLSEDCQHLILIGDHKQLRPNTTTYELAKDFKLDISLFERMVNNGFPVKMLNTQHRMRPEVKKFMDCIYDGLENHVSVLNREPVRGISKSVFFFNHSKQELHDDQIRSHSNDFEAEMVSKLARYLMWQDYKPSQITIITMYAGQLLLIQKRMPKSEFEGIKITTVDNFQGEENDIIILSTVRSNEKGQLGFVAIENRICVCLSRAKFGMYVFGNFDMLSSRSVLWRNIVDYAKNAGELGRHFTLSCFCHEKSTDVKEPKDFDTKAPHGGCLEPCNAQLKCGHRCKLKCHYKDLKHEEYRCTEQCIQRCDYGHPCPEKCYIRCPPCKSLRDFTLSCGHTQKDTCSRPLKSIRCSHPCEKTLDCYHECKQSCSEPCKCTKTFQRICIFCGEIKAVLCGTKPPFPCDTKCSLVFPCGHQCQGKCSDCQIKHADCAVKCIEKLRCGHNCEGTCSGCKTSQSHRQCEKKCEKMLPCGHLCQMECAKCLRIGGCNPQCGQSCMLRCSHGQLCSAKCGQVCAFHVHSADQRCSWGCEHQKCNRKCGEPCSHIPCAKPCGKESICSVCKKSNKCFGLCSDPCPKMCPDCAVLKTPVLAEWARNETSKSWIELQDCRHVLPENYVSDIVRRNRGRMPMCPIEKCKKAILNTPRYVAFVRQESYRLRMDAEEALKKMQEEMQKDVKRSREDFIEPQPKLGIYESGQANLSGLMTQLTLSDYDLEYGSSERFGSARGSGTQYVRARENGPRQSPLKPNLSLSDHDSDSDSSERLGFARGRGSGHRRARANRPRGPRGGQPRGGFAPRGKPAYQMPSFSSPFNDDFS